METHPLNVLLLGWDEAAPAAAPTSSAALATSRHLAEHTPVSVIVPRLPASATLTSADQVIRLNMLSAAQLAAAATAPRSLAAASWQAPAAPYAGAAAQSVALAASPGSAAAATQEAGQRLVVPSPAPPDARVAPAPGPGLLNEDAFAEATAEIGTEEAAALDQPANDLTLPLAEPAQQAAAPGAAGSGPLVAAAPAAEEEAAQASFVRALQALDNPDNDAADLNFRVIQYARFATPLAVSQPFGVIYAAAWPAWLAALEIRQRTGRPLVLHVQSLAADRNSPADRGWILELERLALRRADLVLANTEDLAQRLASFYNLPAARIRVVDADDSAALNDALTHVASRA